MPDVHQTLVAIRVLNGAGGLVTVNRTGTTTDGLEIANLAHYLYLVRGSQISRMEIFDDDRLDDALARFAELTPPADRRPSNAATGALRRIADRLALVRGTTRVTNGESAPTWEVLSVVGADEAGRCNLAVLFDLDDEDAALAELDARYIEGEAAPYADVWRTIAAGVDAYNRRDPAGRALLADDYVVIDHHRLGFPPGDRRAFLAEHAAMSRMVPDNRRTIVSVDVLNEHGTVVELARSGVTEDGVGLEGGSRNVYLVRDGQHTRMEIFPRAEREAAVARFAELTSA